MYELGEIRNLHLETTEKCQAGCPFCPRHTDDGKINPYITNAEITIDQAREFFPKSFIKQLRKMYMCGNYGDPAAARDTLEIFELFRYNNTKMALDMHTNGGMRDPQWWKDLAFLMYDDYSRVIFSFDGLEDTNHIYRKNVNWDIAMRSAESFIAAGGKAEWSFIIFRHNEHQVEEARALSEKMGFHKFVAKKSARFTSERAAMAKDALLPPLNPKYQNKNIEWRRTHKIDDSFYDTTEIDCMVAKEKSIYVSAKGELFPCCWVGGVLDDWSPSLKFYGGNYDGINLNKHSLQEIFDSGIFKKIEQSWGCTMANGRMKTCANICSKGLNFFKAQYQD